MNHYEFETQRIGVGDTRAEVGARNLVDVLAQIDTTVVTAHRRRVERPRRQGAHIDDTPSRTPHDDADEFFLVLAAPTAPRAAGPDRPAGPNGPDALDVLHLWLGEQRTPAEHQADRLGIHLTRTAPKET